jgi:hypothetical protein
MNAPTFIEPAIHVPYLKESSRSSVFVSSTVAASCARKASRTRTSGCTPPLSCVFWRSSSAAVSGVRGGHTARLRCPPRHNIRKVVSEVQGSRGCARQRGSVTWPHRHPKVMMGCASFEQWLRGVPPAVSPADGPARRLINAECRNVANADNT